MRGFLLFTLIALSISQTYAVECPADDGTGDILLPNPADCTTFYKCLNGVPFLMSCPGGLEWSDALKRCDYPEIAQCEETETSEATKPPPTTPSKPPTERPDKCPEEDGPEDVLLPNPADCGSFFKCLNGEPHLIHCPAGQEWSIELNRCDYPEIAQCKETETKPVTKSTEIPSKTPSERPDKCPEEDGPDDVLLPNPEDCGSFFKCWNGVPHLIPCPAGQEWSVELSRCDYPEIAKCSDSGDKPTTKPSISTTTKPPVEGCPAENGPEDVLLPNPKDCGSFYKCLNGIPYLIPCPSGLHWSIELNRCDYPEIAKCKQSEFKPLHPKETKCPAEDGPEDVLLPNPADCGSFYKCLAGIPILHQCPPGLHWSVEQNRCEYPDIAQCVETETSVATQPPTAAPTTSAKPPGERPDHCPDEDGEEDVLLPNPDDCGSFFKCLTGEPVLISCPSGLHWSTEFNRCEFPDIAQCESKSLKALLYESECPLHNDGYDILLPNPDDCSTFYQCSNGVKILKHCPEGTLWHAQMGRCDHASIAECA